jgi:hypothetical protein
MATKKSQKISYKEAHDRAWWPLFLFFFFIIVLVGGFLIYKYWQKQNYYSSIQSFVFSSYTGPVSPEFQSTKTLTLTANSCTYVVVNNSGTNTQNCDLSKQDFYKLVNLYYASDVGTKISYNNNASSKPLIGGPTKKVTVNFADGSSSSTIVSTDFLTNAQNFLSNVASYVAQFKSLGF